jgi:hypothetical protein
MGLGAAATPVAEDRVATSFEVLDALGLAELRKRRGDLDGTVPVRAVQGCQPLLAGNAFGFQVTLLQPLTLRRLSGTWTVASREPFGAALAVGHRAALHRLVRQGVVRPDSEFARTFAGGFVQPGADGVLLWTGLCVRPDAGVVLRVSATANRRNRSVGVAGQRIADTGGWVPLVLRLTLPADGPGRVLLAGEVATVAPLAPGVRVEEVPLAAATPVGAAHAAFYDEAYAAAKRSGPTRRYRALRPLPEEDGGPPWCRVVPLGPAPRTTAPDAARLVLGNPVPFEASFDGRAVTLDPDRGALWAGAREVERTFADAMGPGFLDRSLFAVRHLTRYLTAHPPGEPHFFAVPWVLVQTSPGWSCLLEAVHGDGVEGLRAVVATDVFHTVPAVFQLHTSTAPVRFDRGRPLLEVVPVPRRLVRSGFRQVPLARPNPTRERTP